MSDNNNFQQEANFFNLSTIHILLIIGAVFYIFLNCLKKSRATVPNLDSYTFRPAGLIGDGGFGKVDKCTYQNHSTQETGTCAVKTLKPTSYTDEDLEKQWAYEARRLASSRGHDNVLGIIGADVVIQNPNRKVFRIATEYVPKGSLSNHLSKGWFENQPWVFKLKIARGICAGLKHIHDKHIIHMDLKSDNILLGNGDIPKIADFGLARYRPYTSWTFQNYQGPLGGDDRYSAPESYLTPVDIQQIQELSHRNTQEVQRLLEKMMGQRITRASDIFSLGIVLWEVAVGKITTVRSAAQMAAGEIPGNTNVDRVRFFRPAIIGCTKFKPEDRWSLDQVIHSFDDKDTQAARLDNQGCRLQ